MRVLVAASSSLPFSAIGGGGKGHSHSEWGRRPSPLVSLPQYERDGRIPPKKTNIGAAILGLS